MKRIAFLASGNGTTMRRIIAASQAGQISIQPVVVISNRSASPALGYAREQGIPARYISKRTVAGGTDAAVDRAMLAELRKSDADLVFLSGYMQQLGPQTVRALPVINAHPASFASPYKGKGFYGLRVHQAVLDAHEAMTAVTLHLVDEVYDHGKVLATKDVPVYPTDTAETLQARVQVAEGELAVDLIGRIARDVIDIKSH